MGEILSALENEYSSKAPPVTAVIGVRQDSNILAPVVGFPSDSTGVARFDDFVASRLRLRELGVRGALSGVAGNYDWKTNDEVLSLGADATRFRVLGDIAIKAMRTDREYLEVAKEYYRQANEALESAEKLMLDAIKFSAGSNPPSSTQSNNDMPRSGSLRIKQTW